MEDLRKVLEINRAHYRKYGEEMPVLDEFVIGYRWFMAADTKGRLSQALRVGREKTLAEQERVWRSMIGRRADECLEEMIGNGDDTYREAAVSLCGLLSKPFNTKERLAERGITRTEGLRFSFPVEGKKVGIIGYGLYNDFFYGKCAEFHAFDLRGEKGLLTYRIGKTQTRQYPEGIIWHLGENAAKLADVLGQLDIVIMTGCTIVNDTYRAILAACKNAQLRGIYGPSSELSPEYLFDLGYNYIFSASVRDKETYLRATCAPLPDGRDLAYMDMYELKRE